MYPISDLDSPQAFNSYGECSSAFWFIEMIAGGVEKFDSSQIYREN